MALSWEHSGMSMKAAIFLRQRCTKKSQELFFWLYHQVMDDFRIALNRSAGLSLVEQIRCGIATAIREGQLYAGARLPSWRDLAAQLGVARGTVRAAYELLIDEQLLVARGAAGTYVAEHLPTRQAARDPSDLRGPLPAFYVQAFGSAPLVFQMGVPAQDVFPYALWSRMAIRAARQAAQGPTNYPDPRGELGLRTEIAAYLAVARGLVCSPAQILVTNGYAGALGLAIHGLPLRNADAWFEEPGYPLARAALMLAGIRTIAVEVDEQGMRVDQGIAKAPNAALAVVTAGQQAPLGMPLSLARRHELLGWASRTDSWVIEDDYLSELQLAGRAAPALASLDRDGRVIHIGTFSKTISPTLRLGFMVVPITLANRFADAAAVLAPAPPMATQLAVAEFMKGGHYLRHLRRMKRIYASRLDALRSVLGPCRSRDAMAGLALLLPLPDGVDDEQIARQALADGLAPSPLTAWYAEADRAKTGLLLGITNLPEQALEQCCERLLRLIQ